VSFTAKVLSFVLFATLAGYIFTLLDFHSEQDQCSFGPVSNERYRQLLADAEWYQMKRWPPFVWSGDTLGRLLSAQYQEMSEQNDSAYEKIAKMHAIFRGIGADFLYTEPNDAFSQAVDLGSSVSFGYHINVHRLTLFYPLGRTGWLIGSLAGPVQPGIPGRHPRNDNQPQGHLRVIAWYPNPVDPIPKLSRGLDSCPAVPNSDLAPFFKAN